MHIFLAFLGLAIFIFGAYLALNKGKKIIGYILMTIGMLIIVLMFPYLPKWVEWAITG